MKIKKEISILSLIAWAVLLPPVYLLFAAYYGWALSTLWLWFFVPLGLPIIGIWQMSGIMLFKSLVFLNFPERAKETSKISESVGSAILAPILILFIGYITKTFLIG